jgi:cardiolipin synthase
VAGTLVRLSQLLACLALAACATLPDVRQLAASLPAHQVVIATSDGTLSGRQAESLLARRLGKAAPDKKRLAALEQSATGSPLISGNKVTLLFDGPQTLRAMMAAIADARNNINLETYIFEQDELGLKFADLLIARQRAGVQVNIIYDSVGTLGTPAGFFDKMRDAGIRLTEFNPVNPIKAEGAWRLNNRDHRKILVVDGKIGFTGGINIAREYSSSSVFRSRGSSRSTSGWRDTHVQVEGPAVAALQWLFLDTWASRNPGELPDLDYFPTLQPAGDQVVRIIASQPDSDFEIYKAYVLALQQAKKSIHLTVAYFAPDAQLLDALRQAAGRGVQVMLVFPSITDANVVMYAGRSFYKELLEAGVRIFELQESVLHAKTAVIDGTWSTVGSANVDIRSFLHNREVNLVVLGQAFGQRMESAFQEDVKNSVEITLEQWQQRSLWERLREWAARRLVYYL